MENFDNVTNFNIINATIKFIKTTKRFKEANFKLLIGQEHKISKVVSSHY